LELSKNDELMTRLRALGLSYYEAKAYITLLQGDAMTTTEIAKKAHIPQPRVYDVLHSLEEKALVISSDGRPKLYRAVEPRQALLRLTKRLERNIRENYEVAVNILEKIYKTRPKQSNDIIWRINSLANLKLKIIEAINYAEHEVLVSCYKHMMKFLEKPLKDAYKRGVSTCLVSFDEIDAKEFVDELRIRKTRGIVIVVPDRKMLVFSTILHHLEETTATGYYTENKGLIKLFTEYFLHNLRDLSKPIYFAYGDKVFNRRFTNILRAIDMINILREKKANVIVKVYGRLVSSREPTILIGRPINTLYNIYIGVARITVRTIDGRTYTIGGWGAYLEDIESDIVEVIGEK